MHHTHRTKAHLSLATLAFLGACTRSSGTSSSSPVAQATNAAEPSPAAAAPTKDEESSRVERSARAPMAMAPAAPPSLQAARPKGDALTLGNGRAARSGSGAALGGTTRAMAEPKRIVQVPRVVGDPTYREADDRAREAGTETYAHTAPNAAVDPRKDRLSTFAIDVDTASYALARRKLREGQLPTPDSVRVEEFVNSFDYGDEGPTDGSPMALHAAMAPSPMNAGHHILRVNLQAKRLHPEERKPVHLVYLVDVSGSMQSPDKIGLAKQSLHALTRRLGPKDTVALCTYAGSTREVLPPTGVAKQDTIHEAIEQLTAGGSTAMASGIDIAYGLAARTHVPGEISHVVVLSDGDANVGPTSHEAILRSIASHKDKGITLSTVGFGTGNYNDQMMEQLADKGDGNYSYIDSAEQADRVFGHDVDGLLQVVARDTKVQVEFSPEIVKTYRLVGYENRDVADRDFRNDHVDAGEVGAGHAVTALYDLVLGSTAPADATFATVRFRYAPPSGGAVVEKSLAVRGAHMFTRVEDAPASFRFSLAVAGLAENLRSTGPSGWSLASVEGLARSSVSTGKEGAEFLALVSAARRLRGQERAIVAGGAE